MAILSINGERNGDEENGKLSSKKDFLETDEEVFEDGTRHFFGNGVVGLFPERGGGHVVRRPAVALPVPVPHLLAQ